MIHARDLSRSYDTLAGAFAALAGIDLDVAPGELVVVRGPSGSGKSTLLHLLGGIDRPTGGTVTVAGQDLGALPRARLAPFRGRNVGIVFQFFQLLPTLTARENVLLPMELCGRTDAAGRRARAQELLARFDVEAQADHLPAALSGGQQQRVALARALANDPPVVLADEPTGNLDRANGAAVLGALRALARAGKAVVVVTHEGELAASLGRAIALRDGRLAT